MQKHNIFVIGAGGIGLGLGFRIAKIIAGTGSSVSVVEINSINRDRATEKLSGMMTNFVKEKHQDAVGKSIQVVATDEGISEATLVIEAATENLDGKISILRDIEPKINENCPYFITSSTFARDYLAESADFPNRVFNLHPFTPAARNSLIEFTASECELTTSHAKSLLEALGFDVETVAAKPLFAGNRIVLGLVLGALHALEKKLGSIPEIDHAINEALGGGGPFRVLDMVKNNPIIITMAEEMARYTGNEFFYKLPDFYAENGTERWYPKSYDFEKTIEINPNNKKSIQNLTFLYVAHLLTSVLHEGICTLQSANFISEQVLGIKDGIAKRIQAIGRNRLLEAREEFPEINVSITEDIWENFHKDVFVTDLGSGVSEIRVRNPQKLNAMNPDIIRQLTAAYTELNNDPSVAGIIFDCTISGADIKALAKCENQEELKQIIQEGQNLTQLISKGKNTITISDGFTLGGGCEMFQVGHYRIASQRAQFGQPECNWGLLPGYGGTVHLMRLIGPAKAFEWICTGKIVKASEAQKDGLVQDIVEDKYAAKKLARQILTKHPEKCISIENLIIPKENHLEKAPELKKEHCSEAVNQITEETLLYNQETSIEEGLEKELEAFLKASETEDFKIGTQCFVKFSGKKKPEFIHC